MTIFKWKIKMEKARFAQHLPSDELRKEMWQPMRNARCSSDPTCSWKWSQVSRSQPSELMNSSPFLMRVTSAFDVCKDTPSWRGVQERSTIFVSAAKSYWWKFRKWGSILGGGGRWMTHIRLLKSWGKILQWNKIWQIILPPLHTRVPHSLLLHPGCILNPLGAGDRRAHHVTWEAYGKNTEVMKPI